MADLERLIFPDNCMNEKTLENELEIGKCYLQEMAEGIAAYALVRQDAGILDILRFGVHPDYRRKGLGSKLLGMVLKEGKPTMLTVKRDNEHALDMYLRHGFAIVGYLAGDKGWVMRC